MNIVNSNLRYVKDDIGISKDPNDTQEASAINKGKSIKSGKGSKENSNHLYSYKNSKNQSDISVEIIILPTLKTYRGSFRNNLNSRSWDTSHDGMSIAIYSVKFENFSKVAPNEVKNNEVVFNKSLVNTFESMSQDRIKRMIVYERYLLFRKMLDEFSENYSDEGSDNKANKDCIDDVSIYSEKAKKINSEFHSSLTDEERLVKKIKVN